MKHLSVLLFLIFAFKFCIAQNNIIKGQVVDGDTGQALAFCNIGWINLNKGTVSSQNGSFNLEVLTEYEDAVLRVSKMGYQKEDIAWSTIQQKCYLGECVLVVELYQKALDLPEFTIESKTTSSSKVWGKPMRKSIFGLAFNPKDRKPEENLGREIGMMIDSKKRRVRLNDLKMSLSTMQFENATFRLNLYKKTNAGHWELHILPKEIIFHLNQKNIKDFTFDLSDFNIIIQGEYLIGIEWLDFNRPIENGILTMTTGFPIGKSYLKNSSHDQWGEIKGAPSIQVSGAVID